MTTNFSNIIFPYIANREASVCYHSNCHIPCFRVQNVGSLWRSNCMYCVDFAENASFADAKLLDFSPSDIAHNVLLICEITLTVCTYMYAYAILYSMGIGNGRHACTYNSILSLDNL